MKGKGNHSHDHVLWGCWNCASQAKKRKWKLILSVANLPPTWEQRMSCLRYGKMAKLVGDEWYNDITIVAKFYYCEGGSKSKEKRYYWALFYTNKILRAWKFNKTSMTLLGGSRTFLRVRRLCSNVICHGTRCTVEAYMTLFGFGFMMNYIKTWTIDITYWHHTSKNIANNFHGV